MESLRLPDNSGLFMSHIVLGNIMDVHICTVTELCSIGQKFRDWNMTTQCQREATCHIPSRRTVIIRNKQEWFAKIFFGTCPQSSERSFSIRKFKTKITFCRPRQSVFETTGETYSSLTKRPVSLVQSQKSDKINKFPLSNYFCLFNSLRPAKPHVV